MPTVQMIQPMSGLDFNLVAGDTMIVSAEIAVAWEQGNIATIIDATTTPTAPAADPQTPPADPATAAAPAPPVDTTSTTAGGTA